MKNTLLAVFLMTALPVFASRPPVQDEVFSAMRDELARTTKTLHVPGQPQPMFAAYKWEEWLSESFRASLGELLSVPQGETLPRRTALAHLLVKKGKENSGGFDSSRYWFAPVAVSGAAGGYDAVRQAFWNVTDTEYNKQLNVFSEKEAYKRSRQIQSSSPDFVSAKPAQYYEDPTEFSVDRDYYARLAQRLSAVGKEYKRLEKSAVFINRVNSLTRYVQSEGGEYQTARAWVEIQLSAQMHNKAGVKETPSVSYYYAPEELPSEEDLLALAHRFFGGADAAYSARKAEPYLGPVLFTNRAAAGLLEILFVQNVRHAKPLLVESGNDYSAGKFKDKKGLRVISQLFDVYDKPSLREYNGQRLWGFAPVDDEGVAAEELQLVQAGKLLTLPSARNVPEGEKRSNGHARMSWEIQPRSALTNTFFVPKKALSEQELEAELLARCRALGLDYCYIADGVGAAGKTFGFSLQKIYVSDGRKEPVYGAKLQNLTPRSLRDIAAAGADEAVFNFQDDAQLFRSLVTPSLLVEEIEIVPDDVQPEKPALVSQPR